MNVNSWSSSTLSVVEGYTGSIPVHSAWSRDLYRSAAVPFTVKSVQTILGGGGRLRMAGKASEPLEATLYRPSTLSIVGT